MRTTKRFVVAKRAHDLTLRLYQLTQHFPKDERFGLASQLRRASASIGSNIAEGDSMNSNRQFSRHLEIAKGSAGEVSYQLLLAKDLGFLTASDYAELARETEEIRAMLVGLIKRIGQGVTKGTPN